MNAVDPNLRPAVATRLLAGVSVPDTPLISRAIEYAREHSEPYLFNHVMRSWLFAVILAQLERVRARRGGFGGDDDPARPGLGESLRRASAIRSGGGQCRARVRTQRGHR